MAVTNPFRDLRAEVSCPICWDYFVDPVLTQCGHNFCRACITLSWQRLESDFPCPQCRQVSEGGKLLPNRQLGNVADLSRQISRKRKERDEELYENREESLKHFCQEGHHQKPICLLCDQYRNQADRTVCPTEAAAQEYKKILQIHIEKQKKHLEDLQGWTTEETRTASKLEGQRRRIPLQREARPPLLCLLLMGITNLSIPVERRFLEQFRSQRQRILRAFEELKQFLEQEQQRFLSSLEMEQENEVGKIWGKVADLEKQQSSLRNLITELEAKCQQQDVELLKDVRNILSRSGNVKILKPKDDSAELEQNLQSFSSQHAYLQIKIKELQESIPAELDLRGRFRTYKVRLTLDPDTAHRRLILSEDRRCVRAADTAQPLPDNPRRFTAGYPCVLGSEGFTSGKHYWELQLLKEEEWELGVAEESVSRKRGLTLSPEGGVWAVGVSYGQYRALTSPPSRLSLRENPRKLGVYLDYEGGRLSVYNGDTMGHLYTFTQASFTQRVFPFFCLWEAELSLV